MVKPEPYNGMILVDLLNLSKDCPVDTLHEYTVFFHGDNQDTLTATERTILPVDSRGIPVRV